MLAKLLAVVMTIATLFTLAGYQVTSETAATRLLGRLGSAMIEMDRWLPAHEEDIRLVARDRRQNVVAIGGLPIEVTLPSSQLADADQPAMRSAIVEAIGQTLYEQGTGAFRDDEGNRRLLSAAEPVRWTVSLLDEGTHKFWRLVLPVSLLLLLASIANAMVGGGMPLRLLLLGSVLSAIGAGAGWGLAVAGESIMSSAVDKEIMLILRDGAWIGLRNSVAVAVICLTLTLLLSLMTRQRIQQQQQWPSPPPDASSV